MPTSAPTEHDVARAIDVMELIELTVLRRVKEQMAAMDMPHTARALITYQRIDNAVRIYCAHQIARR